MRAFWEKATAEVILFGTSLPIILAWERLQSRMKVMYARVKRAKTVTGTMWLFSP